MKRWLQRPELALFITLLVGYAYFYQAGGWNQNSRFDLTRAVVEQGTASINDYHRNTGDKSRRARHYYCDKAPGVSYLAVPIYAVTYWGFGPEDGQTASSDYLAGAAHVSTVWTVAIPSALSAVALCVILAAFGVGRGPRMFIAAAYGLATLAFPYSTVFYGHQLSGALTLIAFAFLVREKQRAVPPLAEIDGAPAPDDTLPALAGGGKGGGLGLFLAGLTAGTAVAVEYPAALALVVLFGYAATFVRPWPRLAYLVAGAAIPGLLTALYHGVVFGGPFTLPYEFSTQPHRSMGFFMGLGIPDTSALWHITFGSYRGLFFSAPWLLLFIPGAVRLWRYRSGRFRAELVAALTIFVLYLWLNASLVDWQGGWAMGARYLVPCIPFLVIAAAGLALPIESLRRLYRRIAWTLAAVLIAYSFALMLIGTAVKPEVPVHIKRPFGEYLVPAFRRGDLAVSTQSIDMKGAPRQAPKQAWNLGMRAGLSGHASLVPLALAWLGCAGWMAFAVRLQNRRSSGTLRP